MQYEEKYGGFTVSHLIKHVQSEYITLTNPQTKKKISQKILLNRLSILKEIQFYLTEKLRTLDRTQCDFFPVGSFVEYTDYKSGGIIIVKENAKVVGYKKEENKVVAEFEKKPGEKVDISPLKLKLRYIKEYYL